MSSEIKVGDRVELLYDYYGYQKGDIATVVRKGPGLVVVVSVSHRTSTSGLFPYVSYSKYMVRKIDTFKPIEQHYVI